jgi:hypothetical protein
MSRQTWAAKLPVVLLLAGVPAGCDSLLATTHVETMRVAEVRAACRGFVPTECLLVWSETAQQWHYFSAPIQGFTHEWGTRYVLRVEQRRVRNPPVDGSDVEYRLRRIVSTEPSPLAARIAEFRAAELKWAAVRPPGPAWNYRFVLERICDCPPMALAQVEASRFYTEPPRYAEDALGVTSVPSGETVPDAFQNGFRPIWDLFGMIYYSLLAAHDIDVDFHESLGYPTRIMIDPHADVHGDAVVFHVHSLEFD